ncbi:MAG: bifunctional phosphoglucose/phosphomannose isomerase, partial [Anaerolineae bacterium]|nr:bifunctional phosphoglucose/phosphomannose isomerase [Anaerolineae bacterium]
FKTLDSQDMIAQINGLPDQLASAYQLGLSQPLPAYEGISCVVISGMGGSAIGADLVASYVSDLCRVPVVVHRDYDLPAYATGPSTLVVASSHSGNTEETLSSFQAALLRGCRLLVFCTGGKLAALAGQNQIPVWKFQHNHAPRTAVGFSFGLLLAALFRLGLIPDPADDLRETLHAMGNLQTNLKPEAPVAHNPAKRMAGQLFGRWVSVFSADYMAPVARRWKGQFSELAKAWAQFEYLPEADHNTLAGTENPPALLGNMLAVFLTSRGMNERNQHRLTLTREMFMQQGINTDTIEGRGNCKLAQMWTALLFGDYTSYYLAMAYGVDPTPIAILDAFKAEMAQQ